MPSHDHNVLNTIGYLQKIEPVSSNALIYALNCNSAVMKAYSARTSGIICIALTIASYYDAAASVKGQLPKAPAEPSKIITDITQ